MAASDWIQTHKFLNIFAALTDITDISVQSVFKFTKFRINFRAKEVIASYH